MPTPYVIVCEVCTRTVERTSKRAKYCSRRCRDWKRHHPGEPFPVGRQCKHCRADIDDRSLEVRFCSLLCQKRELNGTPQAPAIRDCVWCGVAFDVKHASQFYCGKSCRNIAGTVRWREANPEKAEAARLRSIPSVRAGTQRWRAQKRKTTIEVFTHDEIFTRDKWVCQLCKRPVLAELRFPDPDSPSLDHRIPLSRQGTHTRDNVQLAHLLCNVSKGAKLYAVEA